MKLLQTTLVLLLILNIGVTSADQLSDALTAQNTLNVAVMPNHTGVNEAQSPTNTTTKDTEAENIYLHPNDEGYEKFVSITKEKAEKGDVTSQFRLGIIYSDTNDNVQARKWFLRAAEQGSAHAQTNLGYLYQNGLGGDVEIDEALKLYRLASKQNDSKGQTSLAMMYESGNGVKQDMNEAIRLYRLAAEQNECIAENNLGNIYYSGLGVKNNNQFAFFCYKRSAEHKCPVGQYNLGQMYIFGHGVKPDAVEGAKWIRLAADQGYADAQYYLGKYLIGLNNIQEAQQYVHKAAIQGLSDAQVEFGQMLWKTQNSRANLILAQAWFHVAVASGSKYAVSKRTELATLLTSQEDDTAFQLSKAWKKGQDILVQ